MMSKALLLFAWLAFTAAAADPIRVLLVTGGHRHDASFYKVIDDDPGFETKTGEHSFVLNGPFPERFSVIALYDMYDNIGDKARANLKRWVDEGRGIVSIHHAVVDYTDWPWWYEQVTGGKYFIAPHPSFGASENSAEVEMTVRPVGRHPVVEGVGEFRIVDEPYRKMWRSPRIQVLMETDHPANDRPIVYVGPSEKSRAVYIQLGHGRRAHNNPAYQRLVRNAVRWAAGGAR